MKSAALLTLCLLISMNGCASNRLLLTKLDGHTIYLEKDSPQKVAESVWQVWEIATERMDLGRTFVEYDCERKTRKVLRVQMFPFRTESGIMEGAVAEEVLPGSPDEARLVGVCEFVKDLAVGGSAPSSLRPN